MPDNRVPEAAERPSGGVAIGHAMFASALGALAEGQAPHVKRYLARVDERLAELANDTCRRGFLGDELAKWQFRYSSYRERLELGLPTDDAVTCWDYVETINELDLRIGRLPAVSA